MQDKKWAPSHSYWAGADDFSDIPRLSEATRFPSSASMASSGLSSLSSASSYGSPMLSHDADEYR